MRIIQFQIRMGPDEAQKAKSDLGLLVITFGTSSVADRT